MSIHAYHELYYHIGWATHNRDSLISREERPQLLQILAEEVRKHDGTPIRHNAMPGHVHLLDKLPPTAIPEEFVRSIHTTLSQRFEGLRWQDGYGIVTLRGEDVKSFSAYIDSQEERHRDNKLSPALETFETATEDGPKPFCKTFYHFTWSTLKRERLILPEWRQQMLSVVEEQADRYGGKALGQNAEPEHVHLVGEVPPTVAIAEFIGRVKGSVAYRVNKQLSPRWKLEWQQGYGVVSIRETDVTKVCEYVGRQEEHHREQRLERWLEIYSAITE